MTTITIERAVVHRALSALEYHTQQTRPIHNTELVIEELRATLAAPATAPEGCWCDEQGIGKPGVSCGDCPTRDYKAPDELERLRKDAERLDWYENNAEKVLKIGHRWYIRNSYCMPIKKRNGFRDAIDAAMKEQS